MESPPNLLCRSQQQDRTGSPTGGITTTSKNYNTLVTSPKNNYNSKATNLYALLSIAVISVATIDALIGSVESVITPPNILLYTTHHHSQLSPEAQGDHEPYKLTINEQDGVSVGINSKSNISINLNRAVPELITIRVTVNSGPNLIIFDSQKPHQGAISKNVTPNEYYIDFAANTFGDRPILFHTTNFAGHAEIVCQVAKQPVNKSIVIDDSSAFASVNIYRSWNLNVAIQIVGWIYFFAWSISFYFQVILNHRRKSVVGLNFDFLGLNLLGFACYTIYNASLLFSYSVQKEYYKRYTYSRIPVEYNDLFFAIHAFLITLVTVTQCFFYERAEQHVSLPAGIFASLAPVLGFGLFLASFFSSVSILDVVLYLSYVKLVITTIKYTPQAYMNYKRKATTGWSIHNIILDFIGGSFSLLQMFLLAYNYDDWISIFGNFTKFGLGLISMLFDIIFLIQHYALYPTGDGQLMSATQEENDNSSYECPSPVISRSIISTTRSQSHVARNNGPGGGGGDSSIMDSEDNSD